MTYLVTFFFILACLMAAMWLFQRKLMYFPDPTKPNLHAITSHQMQEVSLQTTDGLKIYGWYQPPQSNKPTIVYFHGNAGNLLGRMPLALALAGQGYGIFLLEYRGYGGSDGTPTEQGLYHDARAAMLFLKKQHHPVVIYGESLGTGVAVQIATEFSIKGLVLQTPFSSMTEIAKHHYPYILIGPKDQYDNFSKIKRIKVPLLILHGTEDTIVPFHQAKKLFSASGSDNKHFRAFEGKSHNNLWDDAFLKAILLFLDRL